MQARVFVPLGDGGFLLRGELRLHGLGRVYLGLGGAGLEPLGLGDAGCYLTVLSLGLRGAAGFCYDGWWFGIGDVWSDVRSARWISGIIHGSRPRLSKEGPLRFRHETLLLGT